MVYEGISFNEEWVAAQTLKGFTLHEKHHGLSREDYEEIYFICKDVTKSDNPLLVPRLVNKNQLSKTE